MVSERVKTNEFYLNRDLQYFSLIPLYSLKGTNEPREVVTSLATTLSSFGKKADLIDVKSLQLLKPENMSLPMEESKDIAIRIQSTDGYEKPIAMFAAF